MKIAFSALSLLLFAGVVVCADEPKTDKEKQKEKGAQEAKAAVGLFRAIADAVGEIAGAIAGQPVGQPQGDPDVFVQQFKPHFQQLVQTELHFIRKVCQPTNEQYKVIQAAGDQTLKDTVLEFAKFQMQMQQGAFNAARKPALLDPRLAIAQGLSPAVEATLTAEQAQKYRLELEKRAAARKRAALLNLVAQLDKDLVLSPEQRTKITESLNSNWDEEWSHNMEAMMYGNQFMPSIPGDRILPFLDAKQQEIWRQRPRSQSTFFGWAGFGFVQAVELNAEAQVEPAEGTEK